MPKNLGLRLLVSASHISCAFHGDLTNMQILVKWGSGQVWDSTCLTKLSADANGLDHNLSNKSRSRLFHKKENKTCQCNSMATIRSQQWGELLLQIFPSSSGWGISGMGLSHRQRWSCHIRSCIVCTTRLSQCPTKSHKAFSHNVATGMSQGVVKS